MGPPLVFGLKERLCGPWASPSSVTACGGASLPLLSRYARHLPLTTDEGVALGLHYFSGLFVHFGYALRSSVRLSR